MAGIARCERCIVDPGKARGVPHRKVMAAEMNVPEPVRPREPAVMPAAKVTPTAEMSSAEVGPTEMAAAKMTATEMAAAEMTAAEAVAAASEAVTSPAPKASGDRNA